MSLFLTPGQLRTRAEFYHQLGQLTAAGIGLPQALGQLGARPPAHSYRKPLARLSADLAGGASFSEALRRQAPWVPEFDVALLQAGEESGRLEACLLLLARHYEDRAALLREMLGNLAYPVFLFHFAILILPFPAWFTTGNGRAYLAQTLGVLAPVYLIVFLLVYAMQSRHGARWRSGVERVLELAPVLRGARRELALARLIAALEALLSAGVTIIEAWELAARASGSPRLLRVVLAWRPLLEAGRTPAEALSASGQFPDLFANQYATAEMSGQTDQTLRRLHGYYLDSGTRRLRALAQWTPRVVYLGIMLMIAFRVLQFYSGYFQTIQNIGGF